MPIRDRLKKFLKDKLAPNRVETSSPSEDSYDYVPPEIADKWDKNAPAHEVDNFASITGDRIGPDGTTQGAYAVAHGKSGDPTKYPLPQDPQNVKSRFFENGMACQVKMLGRTTMLVDVGGSERADLLHFAKEDVTQMKPQNERQKPLRKAPQVELPRIKEVGPRQDLVDDLYEPRLNPVKKSSKVTVRRDPRRSETRRSLIAAFSIIAGRLEDTKQKWSIDGASAAQNAQVIDQLSAGDPSGQNKYLNWMSEQVLGANPQPQNEVIDLVQRFHAHQQRLPKEVRDLSKLDFFTVEHAVELAERTKSHAQSKEEVQEGSEVVAKTSDYTVYSVKSRAASCALGKGTKWCITGGDYFESYTGQGAKFYFVIEKDNTKHAVAVNSGTGVTEIYDAQDELVSATSLPSGAINSIYSFEGFTLEHAKGVEEEFQRGHAKGEGNLNALIAHPRTSNELIDSILVSGPILSRREERSLLFRANLSDIQFNLLLNTSPRGLVSRVDLSNAQLLSVFKAVGITSLNSLLARPNLDLAAFYDILRPSKGGTTEGVIHAMANAMHKIPAGLWDWFRKPEMINALSVGTAQQLIGLDPPEDILEALVNLPMFKNVPDVTGQAHHLPRQLIEKNIDNGGFYFLSLASNRISNSDVVDLYEKTVRAMGRDQYRLRPVLISALQRKDLTLENVQSLHDLTLDKEKFWFGFPADKGNQGVIQFAIDNLKNIPVAFAKNVISGLAKNANLTSRQIDSIVDANDHWALEYLVINEAVRSRLSAKAVRALVLRVPAYMVSKAPEIIPSSVLRAWVDGDDLDFKRWGKNILHARQVERALIRDKMERKNQSEKSASLIVRRNSIVLKASGYLMQRRAAHAFHKLAGPERIQFLKDKYPDLTEHIDLFAAADPSEGRQKYLDWMVRILVSRLASSSATIDPKLVTSPILIPIEKWHALQKYLGSDKYGTKDTSKDINKYKSVLDLREVIDEVGEKVKGPMRLEAATAKFGKSFSYPTREFARADPSGNQAYLDWALTELKQAATVFDRDHGKDMTESQVAALILDISKVYGRFHVLRKKGAEIEQVTGESLPDINHLSLSEVETFLETHETLLRQPAPEVLYQDSEYIAYGPLTSKAQMCSIGSSNWCVARWGSAFWESDTYMGNDEGAPYFIMIVKLAKSDEEPAEQPKWLAFIRHGAVRYFNDHFNKEADVKEFSPIWSKLGIQIQADVIIDVIVARGADGDLLEFTHNLDDPDSEFDIETRASGYTLHHGRMLESHYDNRTPIFVDVGEPFDTVDPETKTRYAITSFADTTTVVKGFEDLAWAEIWIRDNASQLTAGYKLLTVEIPVLLSRVKDSADWAYDDFLVVAEEAPGNITVVAAKKTLERLLSKFPDSADTIQELAKNDPTSNHGWLDQMWKWTQEGASAKDVANVAHEFDRYSNAIKEDGKSVNPFDYSFKQLTDMLDGLKSQKRRPKLRKRDAEFEIVHEEGNLKIYKVLNKAASCVLGSDSDWCSAKWDRDWYESRLEEFGGAVYIARFGDKKSDDAYMIRVSTSGRVVTAFNKVDDNILDNMTKNCLKVQKILVEKGLAKYVNDGGEAAAEEEEEDVIYEVVIARDADGGLLYFTDNIDTFDTDALDIETRGVGYSLYRGRMRQIDYDSDDEVFLSESYQPFDTVAPETETCYAVTSYEDTDAVIKGFKYLAPAETWIETNIDRLTAGYQLLKVEIPVHLASDSADWAYDDFLVVAEESGELDEDGTLLSEQLVSFYFIGEPRLDAVWRTGDRISLADDLIQHRSGRPENIYSAQAPQGEIDRAIRHYDPTRLLNVMQNVKLVRELGPIVDTLYRVFRNDYTSGIGFKLLRDARADLDFLRQMFKVDKLEIHEQTIERLSLNILTETVVFVDDRAPSFGTVSAAVDETSMLGLPVGTKLIFDLGPTVIKVNQTMWRLDRRDIIVQPNSLFPFVGARRSVTIIFPDVAEVPKESPPESSAEQSGLSQSTKPALSDLPVGAEIEIGHVRWRKIEPSPESPGAAWESADGESRGEESALQSENFRRVSRLTGRVRIAPLVVRRTPRP